MDKDKQLEEQFKQYAEVAKTDKKVDVAGLMMNALNRQDANMVSGRAKKWAYLISVGVPPFGLLFATKYYFSDETDAKTVANICVILTIAAIASFIILGKVVLSGSGTSVQQIQQIKPKDIQQLYQ